MALGWVVGATVSTIFGEGLVCFELSGEANTQAAAKTTTVLHFTRNTSMQLSRNEQSQLRKRRFYQQRAHAAAESRGFGIR